MPCNALLALPATNPAANILRGIKNKAAREWNWS
jgi:hypothetical protein